MNSPEHVVEGPYVLYVSVLCASRFCCFVQALLLFLNAVLPPSSLTVRSEDDKHGRRKAQETKLEPFPCEPW